jgi:hypothetical protein
MKSVYLSCHAICRMRLYNITVQQVYQTLYEPEQVVPSIKERYNAYRRTGDWILRVTYQEEEMRYVVVTVTPRKRF